MNESTQVSRQPAWLKSFYEKGFLFAGVTTRWHVLLPKSSVLHHVSVTANDCHRITQSIQGRSSIV